MTTDNTGRCIVLLDCGRTLMFDIAPPKTGERVWCSYHAEYTRVKDGRAEYRVRCRDCRVSRAFGAARLNAELFAVKHTQKRAGHRAIITQGSRTVHAFGNAEQLSLADIPPF